MKRNKLQTSKTGTLASAIAAGVIAASLLSVLLTALLTNLALNGSLGENSISAFVFLVRAISVLLGSLIGGMVLKRKFLLQVGLTALSYLVVLLAAGIVFYDGSFKRFLSGAASVLTGGVAALLILQRPKIKRHRSVKYNL